MALGVEPAPAADDAGAGDPGRRLEDDIVGDPAPVGSRGERGPARQLAGHQVELGLVVLGGAADVEPVVLAEPSVEGDAVGEEPGKELPLDRHHPPLGDAAEQLSLEQVDARVDRVRRHPAGIRLLDEPENAAGFSGLHEPVRRRIGHGEQGDGGGRPAILVEAEHGGEVGVGQDIAVEHEDEPTHEVDGVADAARGAEGIRFHRVAQLDAVCRSVGQDAAHFLHHVGAGGEEHDRFALLEVFHCGAENEVFGRFE